MSGWLACLFLAAVARAEPEVTVEADGSVVGTVVVAAPAERVRGILADPSILSQLNPDVLGVEVVERNGCDDLEVRTRGVVRPLLLLLRRCPTERGWHESLVRSQDFTAWEVDWSIAPVPGGTSVTYRSRTQVDLPVPATVIRQKQSQSMLRTLVNLVVRAR